MYKISYLIALYNKEEFVVDTISSILKEESELFTIEICIVNDGSTDKSLKVINQYFGKNQKVIIDSLEDNKGKNAAYNKAYKNSSGDYICVFGVDDLVEKGRAETLLNKSIETDKTVYGGLTAFDNNTSKFHHDIYY